MSLPALAIFDLDGTLVDSRRIIAQAMDWAFEEAGLAAPGYERTRQIVGLSLVEACDALLPPDAPQSLKDRLAFGYKSGFARLKQAPDFFEPLYPGARAVLEHLRAEGWRLAAATGKTRAGVAELFDRHRLHPFFDALGCADDGPSKPHPAMLVKVLDELDHPPGRAAMIGDTHWDMTMARAAGVTAFGVAWGFHTPAEIAQGEPQSVHADFAGLLRALAAFRAALAPGVAQK